MEAFRSRRFVFVGGLHRSGTSLLFRCLRDHSRLSGFAGTDSPEDEGQYLQMVYRPDIDYGGVGRFGFKPAAHLDETSHLATRANAERLFADWSRHWDLEKPWLLEKSPANLVRSRFLQALFPGSHFVFILRHPLAVAFSTQRWSKTVLNSLLKHWLLCHERLAADLSHLERALVLRYEDLVADPQRELGRAFSFLGLPPEPLRQEVRGGLDGRYFERWYALQEKRQARARRMMEAFEERVNRFGYSLVDPEETLPARLPDRSLVG